MERDDGHRSVSHERAGHQETDMDNRSPLRTIIYTSLQEIVTSSQYRAVNSSNIEIFTTPMSVSELV